MRVNDAIKFFGSGAELARRLMVSRQHVWNWKQGDGLLPELYARRLDDLTNGRLKFDPSAYGLPKLQKPSQRKRAS